jgi:hypothetical protein
MGQKGLFIDAPGFAEEHGMAGYSLNHGPNTGLRDGSVPVGWLLQVAGEQDSVFAE